MWPLLPLRVAGFGNGFRGDAFNWAESYLQLDVLMTGALSEDFILSRHDMILSTNGCNGCLHKGGISHIITAFFFG